MSDTAGRVIGVLRTCLGRDEVEMGASFAALGADSLDLLELRHCLEREFGRDIPDAWMHPSRTGRDVVAYLRGPGALAPGDRLTPRPVL